MTLERRLSRLARSGSVCLALAVAGLLALPACVPASERSSAGGAAAGGGTGWPMSPDFPADMIIPSQVPGGTFQGWNDYGGGLLGGDMDAGTDVWGLTYERGGEAVLAVVLPESYGPNRSVETWRVVTNLSLAPDAQPPTPVAWFACYLQQDATQLVFTRWAPGLQPLDPWIFHHETRSFSRIDPATVYCEDHGH